MCVGEDVRRVWWGNLVVVLNVKKRDVVVKVIVVFFDCLDFNFLFLICFVCREIRDLNFLI